MKRPKSLRPVHPNAGIRVAYRKRILALVDDMVDSYKYWLTAKFKATPPVTLAQDATPAQELEAELRKLGRRWQKQFNQMADKVARHFAKSVEKRSSSALQKIMRDAGWSVKMKTLTPAMRDVMAASIAENVSLIKSIPEEFHTKVQGMVMRSFTTGRDLSQLSKDLQKQFGVTRKRAGLIALDQNNKATAAFARARYLDLNIKKGIWLHSGAGKQPRPTHVKNNGKMFDIAKGWFDPAVQRYIQPGELIRCRCTARPVVPGFS